MKIIVSLLTVLVVLAAVKILADDPPATPKPPPQFSKPTWEGDDHDQPVFMSPTNAPALTNWPATNMPPMTNWPATNHLPPMTNPPVPQPPTGLTVIS
jgi:hypothetical protein